MSQVPSVLRKMAKAGPIEWLAYCRTRPIRHDVVLYEAYSGSGVLCNPEAIFRALLDDPQRQHLTHVWALTDPQKHRDLARHPRVRLVRRGSLGYHRVLATAGYLINNATFPAEFAKRPGQVYLNTWHGTPLKKMGYDAGERVATRNILRNLVSADYLLSSSRFMTEQLYESAFRLGNVFAGEVIEEGTPRTDLQVPSHEVAATVRRELQRSGVRLGDDEKVILYAPTWRGGSFLRPDDDATQLAESVQEIQDLLPANHRVLLKLHQQVHGQAAHLEDVRDILVPHELSTNRVLACCDVLVTDYSSIFFDFLSTGRPIVFHAPDLDDYGEQRGLYLPVDQWPGPITRSTRELAATVAQIGSGGPTDPLVTHGQARRSATRRFAPHDDGAVTRRVIDVVFDEGGHRHRLAPTRRDERPRVLLYLGSLRPNGITAAAVNLLRMLDPAHADVSVFYNHHPDDRQARMVAQLPSTVRLFPSVGSMTSSKRDRRQRMRLLHRGLDAPGLDLPTVQRVFVDEWRRSFGGARFDHIIDFSGYAPVWAYLSLQGPAQSHSIWLHSDMMADQQRDVAGSQPHARNLRAVISMYDSFDRLVSVSQALSDVNRRQLREVADPEKFTWVPNVIDVVRVQRLAEAEWRKGQAPRPGSQPTFVSVGRLSPEKNHARLIHAFSHVHVEHPDACLLIIGDGPLRSELTALVHSLGLESRVTFTGQLDNPYPLMRAATALVVTSDYEGHSVVTLEARVLGVPVVSTDYPSVRGALPPGVGLVVPRSTEGVAKGMRQALDDKVPHPPFDARSHNAEALDRFLALID